MLQLGRGGERESNSSFFLSVGVRGGGKKRGEELLADALTLVSTHVTGGGEKEGGSLANPHDIFLLG